jgi:hypothetical protein
MRGLGFGETSQKGMGQVGTMHGWKTWREGTTKLERMFFSTGLQPLSISSTEKTVCYNKKFFGGEGKNLAEQ